MAGIRNCEAKPTVLTGNLNEISIATQPFLFLTYSFGKNLRCDPFCLFHWLTERLDTCRQNVATPSAFPLVTLGLIPVRVKGGMSLRNGMWHDVRHGINYAKYDTCGIN